MLKSIFFNTDTLRCVYLFFLVCWLMPGVTDAVRTITTGIVLLWGGLLLLRDLLGERLCLQMKNAWMLIAFLVLFAVTVAIHPEYIVQNVYLFASMTIYLLVVCVPGKPTVVRGKKRAIFVFCTVFIIPATILSAVSLWSYVTEFGIFLDDGDWFGYNQWYPRLKGFYPNPNTAGAVSLISILLLVTAWTLLRDIFNKKSMILTGKITTAVLILINIAMLALTDSRTARVALLFYVLLFSFAAFLRLFSGKLKVPSVEAVAAVLAAVVLTGTVYMMDRPLRIGMAMLQIAVTREESVAAATVEESDAQMQMIAQTEGTLYVISNPLPVGSIAKLPEKVVLPAEDEDLNIIGRGEELVLDPARLLFWKFGLEIIKQHPLFGVSPDGLWDAAWAINERRPEEEKYTENQLSSITRGELHNTYIQLAATNGIPAFLLMMLFLALFACRNLKLLFLSLRGDNYLTAGGVLALCAALAVHNMAESQILCGNYFSTIVFWSFLSFSASLLQDNLNNAADNDKIQDIKALEGNA